MQEDLLGVKVTEPGAGRIEVQTPALTPMRIAGVAVTQRGRVPIAWERPTPREFSLDVTIPANVVATIHIPAQRVGNVSDGHAPLAGDPGVFVLRAAAGDVVLTVGSGHYQFHVPALASLSTGHSRSWPGIVWAVFIAIAVLTAAAVLASSRRGRSRRPVGQ
jgi:hypothetical protein